MRYQGLALFLGVLLLAFALACGISFDSGGGQDDVAAGVEQTLQAVYAQNTLEALAPASVVEESAVVEVTLQPAVTEISHTTIPGNPGSPDQKKDEIDTSNTASDKLALGDSFRLGNFERPFTQGMTEYKKENDLLEILLAEDDDFYIFSLEIVGPGEGGFPSASYGIEFDADRDGRGDILLWAKGGDFKEWTIEDVSVLSDSNEDVGGSRPVLPDNDQSNGYDKVLFSKDVLDDPDAAWQRIDPANASVIQLAIKKPLVGSSRFFWKAWADSGLADPAKFDYNDSFSEEQAGSPNKNSALYPIAQLNLMDSTCWVAYQFQATGKELGGCYQLVEPTPVPPKVSCHCTKAGLSKDRCLASGNKWVCN